MMASHDKIAIKVEGLSKKYRLGGKPSTSFRDQISNLFKKRKTDPEFWALKDINFTLNKGEILGVIGRNGAGKSTLLKLLSRITFPSEGRIEIHGRIASLLEVGTGFHPELTGRENIFLNGTILGMTKAEVREKFDDIVNFSGVQQFIDTPVKRYSSGMRVRLAFAVAAHLEPEILIIDEVLAVGDFEFQKKCLGKMEDVARSGRTVVFVSHNLNAVRNLCNKVMVIQKGISIYEGDVERGINMYQEEQFEISKIKNLQDDQLERIKSMNELIFTRIEHSSQPYLFGEKFHLSINVQRVSKRLFGNIIIGVTIFDKNDVCLIHASNMFTGKEFTQDKDTETYIFEIENNLKPGSYRLDLFIRDSIGIQDWITNGLYIEIQDGNPYGYNKTADIQGVIFPETNIYMKSTIRN